MYNNSRQPTSPEEKEQRKAEFLRDIQEEWDRGCKELDLHIDEWQADEVLGELSKAMQSGDAKDQVEALEHIRLLIGYHMLQKAKAANNPDLQSSNGGPMGGMQVREGALDHGQAKLYFFSGTAGERVLVSKQGLRLPWVIDDKHYTRKTNMVLRDTLKDLFSSAAGEDGHDLMVPFRAGT